MRRNLRARLSFAILIGLIVFLLGSLYHEVKAKDQQIAKLTASNQTIVNKLADIFTHTLQAEHAALVAGESSSVNVNAIIDQIKGVDQSIIDAALQKAYKQVATQAVAGKTGATGATGATGSRGPQGPQGNSSSASTSSSTSTTNTTSKVSTTSTSSTTTTTRSCTIKIGSICL